MRGMIFLPSAGVNEKEASELETLKPPSRELSETLDPVAARLCAAARKLLAERGFRAVTINSVTREAGEYRTSIAYHFGGKDGLLAAVADSIFPRDKCAAAVAECERHPAGPERVAAQMNALREMAEDEKLSWRSSSCGRISCGTGNCATTWRASTNGTENWTCSCSVRPARTRRS